MKSRSSRIKVGNRRQGYKLVWPSDAETLKKDRIRYIVMRCVLMIIINLAVYIFLWQYDFIDDYLTDLALDAMDANNGSAVTNISITGICEEADIAFMQSVLGLEIGIDLQTYVRRNGIGSNVQVYDADLDSVTFKAIANHIKTK